MLGGVIAYHIVLTCYGFWLPNDPRGSWSTFVRAFELYRAGGSATKTETRRSVADRPHDQAQREAAKSALARPAVILNGQQARAVMRGFADYATANDRDVFAAAILPDHAHLVVGRGPVSAEAMARQFKARASASLSQAGLHPFRAAASASGRLPTPWARQAWVVYLNKPTDVRRAIDYVASNPVRAGLRPQRYAWVKPYSA